MSGADLLDLVRNVLGAGLAVVGLFIMAGGTLGVLRFPDFYTRLHAARVTDAVGAAIVLIALAVIAEDAATGFKLLLLAALVAALGPTISHLTANTAHAAGLAPLSGPYTAPRPGQKREQAP
jgi:multicomponent Na+:H+ antiporter subunit G